MISSEDTRFRLKRVAEKVKSLTNRSSDSNNDNWAGFLFILPNVIVFLAFLLVPVLYAFYLSFHAWDPLVQEPIWVGLENYRSLLTPPPWHDGWAVLTEPTASLWWWSVRTTTTYTLATVPIQIFAGLAVALMLDSRIRWKKAYRAAYFMPVMLAGAISAVVWRWMFATNGMINTFLEPLGLAHNWIGDPQTALLGVITIAIWGGIGFYFILFLAGLQNIPEELYDSARMDGAGMWERFRHVTWPNLQNTVFFVLVIAIIWSFQVFAIAHVFAEGGPHYATTTIVVLIYQRAFQESYMGLGAAMAFLLFFIVFLFSYWQYQYRKGEEVEY